MRKLCLVLFLISFFHGSNARGEGKKNLDSLSSSTISGLSFRLIGPAFSSGRISDFAVNPADPSEYYVGVACGNVWKTTNSGTSFSPVFDRYGSYSIGPVVMDPNNHQLVWVGTGEYNSQRSVGFGDGVYKSEDGGQTFTNMGLKQSEHIGRILVDPRNSNVVYVAAQGPLWGPGGERGLYKTTDGGKTWKAVLTISDNTGVSDVVMDPRNPDVMYASAYQRRRHVYTLIDGGPECGIYKSNDGGTSWNKINKGLPEGEMGRIGLAISPVNPDILYAIVEAQADQGGFFRSVNRGMTWEKQSKLVTVSPQYYNRIYCDPADENKVYSMDTYSKVTTDGGRTWKNLGLSHRHVDDHALWIDPRNTRHLMIGGDGGIYETWDASENWQFKPNLPVTQFYRVSVDNDLPFYNVYGGTQDNNSMFGPSRTLSAIGIINDDWTVTHGGDGFETQVDPEDPDIVYAQAQHGDLVRYDRKNGEELPIQPVPPSGVSYRWNWDSPLLISPHNHIRLYFAANVLFKSEDRGNSWEVISPDLTRQIDRNTLPVMGKIQSVDAVAKNASTSFYGNIVSLSESPLVEGLLYVGTDDGLVQVTEDGGKNWRRTEKFPGIPEMTYISCLFASQNDPNTVYALFDNHKNADFKPYALKSTDRGKTWKSVSSDLPERGPLYAFAEDHVKPDLLFLGSEFGAYTTLNGGKHWIPMKSGLPVNAIKDMTIQKRENDLVLATFGRGFYILDDYSPLRHLSDSVLKAEAALFPVKDALMFHPAGGKYSQGETYYAAPNPPAGATFTYYFRESIPTLKKERQKKEKDMDKKGETLAYPGWDQLRAEDREEAPYLLFTIRDAQRQLVRKLKAPATEGVNRITWDFRYASTFPVSSGNLPFDNGKSGYYALPGKYTVSLSKVVDGVETDLGVAAAFNTVLLNNSTLPSTDRQALVAFQQKVSELGRVVYGTNREVNLMKEKVKAMREALNYAINAPPELQMKARELHQQLNAIVFQMEGDPTLSSRNQVQPPALMDRINDLTWSLWSISSSPTQTMRDAYSVIADEYGRVRSSVEKIRDVTIRDLETALDKAAVPWTPGRLPDWKK